LSSQTRRTGRQKKFRGRRLADSAAPAATWIAVTGTVQANAILAERLDRLDTLFDALDQRVSILEAQREQGDAAMH
jgi:hypothetical protein